MAVIEVSAGNILNLYGEAGTNIKVLNVASSMNLGQGFAETPTARGVVDTLALRHTARLTYGSASLSVASTLVFTHYTHPRSQSFFVSSYLPLTDAGAHPTFEDVIDALTLTQTVVGERAYGLPQTLTLTQTVVATHVRSESLAHTLNFQSLAAYFLVNRSFYVLTTPLPPLPPPVTVIPTGNPPNQNQTNPVLFPTAAPIDQTGALILGTTAPVSHPRNLVYFQQGATSIALMRPEYGNSERFDFSRVNRRSRGGDLILFRNEQWPKTKTLSLTFAWITETQKQQMLAFMQATVGQVVVYVDHYGNTWDGFIMTPAAAVTQESLNNKSLSVDFQGVKR